MVVDDSRGVGGGHVGEVLGGRQILEGGIFRDGADKDEIAFPSLVPRDQQAALQDELGVTAVEQPRKFMNRDEFTYACVAIDTMGSLAVGAVGGGIAHSVF